MANKGKYVVIHETRPFISHTDGAVYRYGDEVDLSDRDPKNKHMRRMVGTYIAPVGSDEANKAIAAAEKARRAEDREG
jgi:hypothetical protein